MESIKDGFTVIFLKSLNKGSFFFRKKYKDVNRNNPNTYILRRNQNEKGSNRNVYGWDQTDVELY